MLLLQAGVIMLPILGGIKQYYDNVEWSTHFHACFAFCGIVQCKSPSRKQPFQLEVSAILVEAKDPRAVVILRCWDCHSFKLSQDNLCIKFITNLVIYYHPFIHIHKIYSISILFFSKFPIQEPIHIKSRRKTWASNLFSLKQKQPARFSNRILVWRDQSNIYFPPKNIFPQQFKDFAAQDDFQLLCGRDAASMRQLAGYGFGLPLSRVYAQLLGFWKFMGAIVCMCIFIFIDIS